MVAAAGAVAGPNSHLRGGRDGWRRQILVLLTGFSASVALVVGAVRPLVLGLVAMFVRAELRTHVINVLHELE
jgi:hypothetical protein